uniref:Reverse transcriptase N-terminal domain-containing protein n=1 Tax=Acrosorium ciliolatum TaxID=1550622 RepID=A0A1Z1M1M5_9FLOR|nr:hypothetical protein [Acrosorium ciliolatum]ARW59979.1 hypothetical protein [Acrosorium ciliolatum]
MFDKYHLNINTSWKNLPWRKIYFRILILQKKIFQATQEYNLKKLYKLQKILLNSHEIKIFSINNIFNKFYLYCNSYNKSQYNIQDEKKFIIFKFLYHLNNSINYRIKFYLVIEHIKQYILFLCIEPEWRAKFMFSYYNDNKVYNYFSLIYKSNCSKYIYKLPFNIKYICIKNFINKIQSFIYINNSIKYWLKNNYYINLTNSFNLIYKNKSLKIYFNNSISLNMKYLYNLIFHISLIGLDWYIFHLYECIFFDANSQVMTKINFNYTKIFESLINTFKINLYQKNILDKLNNIMKKYYSSYCSRISIKYIEFLYKKVNFIIYFWQKKQGKNIIFKYNKLIKNNLYFNKYLYIKIVENNYKQL